MRITILQTDIEWAQPQANALQAERLIAQAGPSDLYVLPETWSTGFATDPVGIAEEDDRSLRWMQVMAKRMDAAVSGTVAIKTAGASEGQAIYYNRHYFVKPDGSYDSYDKHHLFSYGNEHLCYTPGTQRTVVGFRGMRFLLLTCYDLRFPLWCRYRGDYDAIIVAASWPQTRSDVWDTLLKARAIENQCYVVGCNRVGSDPVCSYAGHSAVIDAKGRVMVSDSGHATALTAEVSKEETDRFRQKFRVLDDRDRI